MKSHPPSSSEIASACEEASLESALNSPRGTYTWSATAKRAAVNIFLIFHIFSVACWCIPITSALVVAYRNSIAPYFLWVGLFQSWDAFSPSPKATNSHIDAIVLYNDGATRNWSFPRMEQLSLTKRYFKERYRKFVEYLNGDSYSALWPDAARFIARRNNNRPSPVRMVFLVRYWSDIVPRADGSYIPGPWDAHLFYGYTVQAGDLK